MGQGSGISSLGVRAEIRDILCRVEEQGIRDILTRGAGRDQGYPHIGCWSGIRDILTRGAGRDQGYPV